jgi:hypothetical protein
MHLLTQWDQAVVLGWQWSFEMGMRRSWEGMVLFLNRMGGRWDFLCRSVSGLSTLLWELWKVFSLVSGDGGRKRIGMVRVKGSPLLLVCFYYLSLVFLEKRINSVHAVVPLLDTFASISKFDIM